MQSAIKAKLAGCAIPQTRGPLKEYGVYIGVYRGYIGFIKGLWFRVFQN